MNDTFTLKIITPEGNMTPCKITQATLLLESGYYTFKAFHERFVSFLKESRAIFTDEDEAVFEMDVMSGIVEVNSNEMTLLVEAAQCVG